ncbi:MAG: hypothetical protein RBT20_01805 [Syntrophales bacterium]|nr:hypothetical protein [Syntrophales bacterium]
MERQRRPYSVMQICDGLDVPPGPGRQKVHNVMDDFVVRGEIFPLDKPESPCRTYIYNRSWHRMNKGTLNKRIYKAMYVTVSEFSAGDIQRLSEAPDKSWVGKVLRRLREGGYIRAVGRKRCGNGMGVEILYNIPDRDRFRLEVMK